MDYKMKAFDELLQSTPYFNHPEYWKLYRRLQKYIESEEEREYIPFYQENFTDVNIPLCDIVTKLRRNENMSNENLLKLWKLVQINTLTKTLSDSRFKVLKNKIIDNEAVKPLTEKDWDYGYMMRCDWCGNIWDGCAQCTCSLDDPDICY